MIECDKVITVLDIASTKKTNTIATNITSSASISCHSKKVGDCYFLHTVFLVIILLLIITIIWYHYTKQKRIDALTNKMKNNEFIKVKNRMCYYYLTSL